MKSAGGSVGQTAEGAVKSGIGRKSWYSPVPAPKPLKRHGKRVFLGHLVKVEHAYADCRNVAGDAGAAVCDPGEVVFPGEAGMESVHFRTPKKRQKNCLKWDKFS